MTPSQLKSHKDYVLRYPERCREHVRRWGRNNRAAINTRKRERYHTDANYNLRTKIRSRINSAIRYPNKKSARAIELLGCTWEEFKIYTENLFLPGMMWEHVISGKIHIDHIRALVKFDLTNPEEQRAAFRYTNTQPLWARDNINKGCN